jgi:hypothetical protein
MADIRLSIQATNVLESMYSKGYFEDRVAVAKLGFAYAINNYFGKFNPSEYDRTSDSTGINWNIATLDSDQSIAETVRALYSESENPYKLARGIICYGLDKLGERNDRGELFPIYELL